MEETVEEKKMRRAEALLLGQQIVDFMSVTIVRGEPTPVLDFGAGEIPEDHPLLESPGWGVAKSQQEFDDQVNNWFHFHPEETVHVFPYWKVLGENK